MGPFALRGQAAAYVYGNQQRAINAGVLLNDANTGAVQPPSVAPYVFFVLDQRHDVKPFGWNIVNPLAPHAVSNAIQQRWTTLSFGQAIYPNMAAYWEVSLSRTSIDRLQQFDVLYLPISANQTPFTAADTEKLRRFVDEGGQLWIESAGGTLATTPDAPYNGGIYGPLFFDFQINNSSALSALTLPANGARHPIFTTPNLLSPEELFSPAPFGLKVANGAFMSNGAASGLPDTGFMATALQAAAGPVISTGQIGAGEVVATGLNIAPLVNDAGNTGAFCNPAAISTAPVAHLKLLANMLAWTESHPAERGTNHQNASNNDSPGGSVASTWDYPKSTTPFAGGLTPPPGAAVYGNITYLRTADGFLRAFDAIPAEPLGATANPDDGLVDFGQGTSYDEIWNVNVGVNTSAPIVVSRNGGYEVFVESVKGVVIGYDATSGAVLDTLTPPNAPTVAYGTAAAPVAAPAPTFYAGRIYAGQADGTLFVHDFLTNPQSDKQFYVDPNFVPGSTAQYVSAAPTVSLIDDANTNGTILTNDLVAFVPTNRGVYTVFLASQGELLDPIPMLPMPPTALPLGYNTELYQKPNFGNVFIDPNLRYSFAYSLNGSYPVLETAPVAPGNRSLQANGARTGGAPDFEFPKGRTSLPPGHSDPVYGNYNILLPSTPAGSLNPGSNPTRTTIVAATQNYMGLGPAVKMSAPALDQSGDIYYTVTDPNGGNGPDSALFCVADNGYLNRVEIRWRFRLPFAGESVKDADGNFYDALQGFTFVGAPVSDGQGHIYAIAANAQTAQAAILCFDTNAAVYASGIPTSGPTTSKYQYLINQPYPAGGGTTDEFGASPTPITAQQFDLNTGADTLTFINAGALSTTTPANRQFFPNFAEPQPVEITFTPSGTATASAAQSFPVHTNLLWCSIKNLTDINNNLLTGPSVVSGLTRVGDYLFFVGATASASVLYRLDTTENSSASPKVQNPDAEKKALPVPIVPTVPTINPVQATNAGAVSAAPSASNGLMIVNGSTGVSAYQHKLTLVADNNRILEVDPDGAPVWAVDATQPADPNAAPRDLNHPASVTQLTPTDYLVADTGNDRCVRFDRQGKVIWELLRFNDVMDAALNKNGPLLARAQPLTLSQPSSVQIRTEFKYDSSGSLTNTLVHYLIADSGNNRVVEVTDDFDANGALVSGHNLSWVSHTFDQQGRRYRYSSAQYYTDPATGKVTNVAALVTNTRIADLVGGVLGPANADAPGGSIVRLTYDPTNVNAANGNLSDVATSYVVGGTVVPVRNPRFLDIYAPPGAATAYSFLYADDNGAFDFKIVGVALTAQWAFTPAEYQAMTTPIEGPVSTYNRTVIPFRPACLQRVGTTSSGVGKYLVTQSYSQGEIGDPTLSKIGGEVFEVDGDPTLNTVRLGGFGAHTLSRPADTSPLTQPLYAIRP